MSWGLALSVSGHGSSKISELLYLPLLERLRPCFDHGLPRRRAGRIVVPGALAVRLIFHLVRDNAAGEACSLWGRQPVPGALSVPICCRRLPEE